MKPRFTLLLMFAMVCFAGQSQAQTITNYTTTDGLVNDAVNCVTVGNNDVMWFGTQGGVSSFDGTTWTNFNTTTHPDLVNNAISAIDVADDGTVWVGSAFGASKYDGSSWTTYTNADGLGNNQVRDVLVAPGGEVWFATISGITHFDGTTWTSWDNTDGIPFGGVNSLTFLAGGSDLYLGTGLSGISIFDGSNFTSVTSADGLVSDKINAIAMTPSAEKWVATANGVTVLDNSNQFVTNHTRMYIMPPPDTLNPTEDIQIDSQGRVWSGIYVDYLVTVGGVAMWDGTAWQDWDQTDGLVGPVVNALAIDSSDDVWVATSTGISKISGVATAAAAQVTEDDFRAWPNPVADVLHLEFEGRLPSNVNQVEVYNPAMQRVLVQDVRRGETALDLEMQHLDAGLYFVKVGNDMVKVVRQ